MWYNILGIYLDSARPNDFFAIRVPAPHSYIIYTYYFCGSERRIYTCTYMVIAACTYYILSIPYTETGYGNRYIHIGSVENYFLPNPRVVKPRWYIEVHADRFLGTVFVL